MDEIYQEDSFDQRLVRAVNIFMEAFDKFAEYIRSAFQVISDVIKKVNDWLYQRYLESGAKYGETQEGCLSWFKELVAENQRNQELEARGWGHGQEMPLSYLLYLDERLKRRLN